MEITYKENRSLKLSSIPAFEQCRKLVENEFTELARAKWGFEFYDEEEKDYFRIDALDEYDEFIEQRDSQKTLLAKIKVISEPSDLDNLSLSSIQMNKKQQEEKEESQFGNGPFEPAGEEESRKDEIAPIPKKTGEKHIRSIKTQPCETPQGKKGGIDRFFTKDKEKTEEARMQEDAQERQIEEDGDAGVKGNEEAAIKEKSQARIGKSIQSSRIKDTNKNERAVDRQKQPLPTCSFCHKSTPHLYYFKSFHNIKLCESCDNHYQIKSVKSINRPTRACDFCGRSHTNMTQVGGFELFSCTSCSLAWEIAVKKGPEMAGQMNINRYS